MIDRRMLVDSGFLVGLYDQKSIQHKLIVTTSAQMRGNLLIPQVVLPEVVYVLTRNLGAKSATLFLRDFAKTDGFLQDITLNDIARIAELRLQYVDANLDFVDCAIIAIAERLEIKRIATLDHRDFAMVRPKHCDYFEIYP